MIPAPDGPGFDRLSRPAPGRLRRRVRSVFEAAMPTLLLQVRQGRNSRAPLLTFDDGPHPEHTPRVLDLLGASHRRAIFFMVGSRVGRQGPLVRRVLAEGHAIGNHSFSHPAPRTLPTRDYLADVRRGRQILQEVAGAQVSWFRPPHGFLTAGLTLGLWAMRQRIMLWSVDPKDYQAETPAQILAHLARSRLTPRDIILLHDTSPVTVSALASLGEGCRADRDGEGC